MQTTSQLYHDRAMGQVIPLGWGFSAAFDKVYDNDIVFSEWDVTEWDGDGLWATNDDNVIQEWDKYRYADYSDRTISIDWERTINFPYSIQAAMFDVSLNNYDAYFTPDSSSPLAPYILPKRPMRISAGFAGVGLLPQAVGLSQGMPEIDNSARTVSFSCMDYLSEIFEMDITKTIAMQDVRTDEVLAHIFDMFGLLPSQYNLATGRNKIPFLFFDKGTNAGSIFQQLMQAEMGALWLDEQGIIRFDQRLRAVDTSVMTFDGSNIISIDNPSSSELINDVKITSKIRTVQPFQPVFTNAQGDDFKFDVKNAVKIPSGGTAFYPDVSLDDPVISAATPTNGKKTNDSWFTAYSADGTAITSGITISLFVIYQGSISVTFSNSSGQDAYIAEVEIWGEPARVDPNKGTIEYHAYDDSIVAKYGTHRLGGEDGISNDFFGSWDNCDSFSEFVLDAYSEFSSVITMSVKGDPSLQLGDIITVDYDTYDGEFRVIGLKYSMKIGSLETTIKATHYTPRVWVQWDVTEWDDSVAVWAP